MAGERPSLEPRSPKVPEWLQRFDRAFIHAMRRWGFAIIRMTLGLVFAWFGALKVFAGGGPAQELVAQTVYWLPADAVVPALGIVELIIGIGMITGYAIRLVLGLFFLQMAGTFLVLVIRPDIAFESGNLLRLTLVGEFVVKNLVLFAAGVALAGRVHVIRTGEPLSKMMGERTGR